MKKTLKLVGLLIGVLILIIVGGISGYNLIAKNKTFYIYDLRLVVPVENAKGYVYTDSSQTYTSIPNKKVYMTASSENQFEIGVYVSTSDDSRNFKIKSSNTNVAKIVYKSGKCYVQYSRAGEAVISVNYANVVDSFKLEVYDQVADEFSVYDKNYYGVEYAPYFANQIVTYSDETEIVEYFYDYEAYSAAGKDADDEVDNSLLRVDQTHLNKDVFEEVKIDEVSKKLKVVCKTGLTKDTDETIIIQSYYYSEYGDIRVLDNYFVNVHIVAYTPEFLQIVVSKTADFRDATVFVDTEVTTITPSDVENDVTKLEKFLDYQKAETNMLGKETPLYNVYFNEKVKTLYLKIRKVYTNGYIQYLNPTTESENPYEFKFDNNYMKLSANETYYTLTLTEAYFSTHGPTFDVTVRLLDADKLPSEFHFEYKALNAENVACYYDYNAETKVFTYKYWDPRSHYVDEIFNDNGDIIGFGSINMDDIDYSLFE